jgi:hypothetical protein
MLSKVYFKEKLAEGDNFKSYICKVELDPGICFVYEKGFIDIEVVSQHVLIIIIVEEHSWGS